jgi:hypothetical protein
MIILLSPSKGQDFQPHELNQFTEPALLKQSVVLNKILKKVKPKQLQQLMSISESLATLNYDRNQQFNTPFQLGAAKQAALAFKGDVYTGLAAESFSAEDFAFAQQHLRILSGLYGYLKPLDLIMPYRLEMKTKLKNKYGENLYQFWGNQITDLINKEFSDDDFMVNLASNEYFKVVRKPLINKKIINLHFKDTKLDKTRVIGYFAKQARGMMARELIQRRITEQDDIKKIVVNGYRFHAGLTKNNDWVFERQQPETKA